MSSHNPRDLLLLQAEKLLDRVEKKLGEVEIGESGDDADDAPADLLKSAKGIVERIVEHEREIGHDSQSETNRDAAQILERINELQVRIESTAAIADDGRAFSAILTIAEASGWRIDMRKGKPEKTLLVTAALEVLESETLYLVQVGDAVRFVLTPSLPVMIMGSGSYVFPTPTPGVFYNLTFPSHLPPVYTRVFEDLLQSHCSIASTTTTTVVTRNGTVVPREEAEEGDMEVLPPTRTVVALNGAATLVEDVGHKAAVQIRATGLFVSRGVAEAGKVIKERVTERDVKAPSMVPAPVVAAGDAVLTAAATVTPHVVFVTEAALEAAVQMTAEATKVVAKAAMNSVSSGTTKKTGGDGDSGPVLLTEAEAQRAEEYAALKSLGQSTAAVFLSITDALESAGSHVATTTEDATAAVVEKSVGPEAAARVHKVGTVAKGAVTLGLTMEGTSGAKKAVKKVAKKGLTKAAKDVVREEFAVKTVQGKEKVLEIEDEKEKMLEIEDVKDEESDDEFHDAVEEFSDED